MRRAPSLLTDTSQRKLATSAFHPKRPFPDFARALNRDVLVPRPAGRFLFSRLIGREAGAASEDGASGGKLQLLPPGAGGRQQVVVDPAWVAVAVKLVRGL